MFLKGSFIKPKTNVQENDLQAGKLPGAEGWGKEPESEKGLLHTAINDVVTRKYIVSEEGNYMSFFDAIYGSIRNNKPVPVNAEEGLAVIRIIEAAYESSREGRLVQLG